MVGNKAEVHSSRQSFDGVRARSNDASALYTGSTGWGNSPPIEVPKESPGVDVNVSAGECRERLLYRQK